jgi:hypothetical protein
MTHSSRTEWMLGSSPGNQVPRGVLLADHSLLFTEGLDSRSTNLGVGHGSTEPASRWLLELLDEDDDCVCVVIAEGGEG